MIAFLATLPALPIALVLFDVLYTILESTFSYAHGIISRRNFGRLGAASIVLYPFRVLYACITAVLLCALLICVSIACFSIAIGLAYAFAGLAAWISYLIFHSEIDHTVVLCIPGILGGILLSVHALVASEGDTVLPIAKWYRTARETLSDTSEMSLVFIWLLCTAIALLALFVVPHHPYWPFKMPTYS
jgi:hypothetical protein